MKKILLGTAAVFALTTMGAQAQDYNANGGTLSPYVGVYGGYGWSDADINGGGSVDLDGTDYGLYAGIQADALLDATVNQTGLGLTGALEVHYGWSGADGTVGPVNLEKDTEFGVSFRPGLKFLSNADMNINPYGIIGYRRTNFEASAGGITTDEDYDGFELGLGTELVAYDNVGIRLDYTHVWYGEEGGFDPDEDNIRLGVGYKF